VHAKACTSCCDGCMQLSDQQMSMTSAAHPEPLSNALMPTLHRRAKCSRTHRLCACVLGRGGGLKCVLLRLSACRLATGSYAAHPQRAPEPLNTTPVLTLHPDTQYSHTQARVFLYVRLYAGG
jgi:hypothetical protein